MYLRICLYLRRSARKGAGMVQANVGQKLLICDIYRVFCDLFLLFHATSCKNNAIHTYIISMLLYTTLTSPTKKYYIVLFNSYPSDICHTHNVIRGLDVTSILFVASC